MAVAVRVLAGDVLEVTTYDRYLWDVGDLLPIFVAAQAPELVVNDIRHHVLPLYFSRPMSRFDYVAREAGGAHASASCSMTLLPVLLLFLGRVLAAEDVRRPRSATRSAPCPGIVGSGLLHAVVLACLGIAISSPRRRAAPMRPVPSSPSS